MSSFSFVVHATKSILGLALLSSLFACGSAEHQAPNKVNVDRDGYGPNHSLYQHHDIMLELNSPNDIFGDVETGPTLFDLEDLPPSLLSIQEPVPASAKVDKAPAAPLPDHKIWRTRVYVEANRTRQLVFDRAGIKPKLGATRPSWMGGERKVAPPCQKPLRRRALTRLGADGKVVKSFRKPGLVN